MKNLHKKIGAMVLAGMVVLGGVAAGGVNSFAASNESSISIGEQREVQRVKFALSQKPFNGEIIEFSKDINKIKKLQGSNRIQRIQNDRLVLDLYNLRNKGNVKIKYGNIYYAIKFNK